MKIAVVIPCYRVRRQILDVLEGIGPAIAHIFVVDDACPEGSGQHVQAHCADPRVRVLRHEQNQGVGGAVCTGYQAALDAGADVVVKLDGDGQMDPAFIPRLVEPILGGQADYAKGNRFFDLGSLESMPLLRKIGNSGLSFFSKLSSGYWNIMDPTNGFTAIHATALRLLPLEKLARRYFFESDMLFRLNTVRAVVWDVPMRARYGDEVSSLRISRVLLDFPPRHLNRLAKRIFYNYFLRDFNACSIELVLGVLLLCVGTIFGLVHWYQSSADGTPATTGTVMLAALPVILGFQLLLSAITFDTTNVPAKPLQTILRADRAAAILRQATAAEPPRPPAASRPEERQVAERA